MFDAFWNKIGDVINWVKDAFNGIVSAVHDLVDIRSIITDDFNQTMETLRELTKESEDFVERAKNLKKHVIRADEVFKLIDEIRTGELRKFVTETLASFQSGTQNAFNEALNAGQGLGLFRSGQLNSPNAVVQAVQKIVAFAIRVTAFVHALKELVPVIQAVQKQIEQIESIIMPQTRPKVKVTDPGYHYSRAA